MSSRNKYIVIGGAVYIIFLVGLLVLLDIADNAYNVITTGNSVTNQDKAMVLNNPSSYKLYPDDIKLILVSIIAAPLNIFFLALTSISDPIESFYLNNMAWPLTLMFSAYILLPILWLIFNIVLRRRAELMSVGYSKFLPVAVLLVGCLISAFVWVRLMFKDFNGFF